MSSFLDLHLRPKDQEELGAMLEAASHLDYGGVAIASGETLEGLQLHRGLDVISRIDLKPRTAGALRGALRRVRRLYEVVAVECRSKAVARQAARDHRVDAVYFPPDSGLWFDEAEAKLSAQTDCAYEINLSELLALMKREKAEGLRRVAEGMENAWRRDILIILSSGASTRLGMRDPRGLASTLTLLDVDYEEALEMVSRNPWSIVQRNRRKLSGEYVMPGVRILREP